MRQLLRGDDVPEPGVPESFNVFIKELQSLGLQVDLFKSWARRKSVNNQMLERFKEYINVTQI